MCEHLSILKSSEDHLKLSSDVNIKKPNTITMSFRSIQHNFTAILQNKANVKKKGSHLTFGIIIVTSW